jgi:hypothetical protein
MELVLPGIITLAVEGYTPQYFKQVGGKIGLFKPNCYLRPNTLSL